jgi:hypothetical protein
MKTTIEERELERSDDFKESTFKIKNSAKAFQILSDGLYQDKIKAIIRELSCNAYDAHIEAGTTDKKIDVFLPTNYDHTFYIRDYGTGLSKHDLENIYTTYFESTKESSNDVVGCLGLGSKSPFSYVNMFTVTSYLDGKQYVYSAFVNEMWVPSITLIDEDDTEEENGIKVQFAVKRDDFRQFAYKAAEVFRYFDDVPNFLGNQVTVNKRVYNEKNLYWGMNKDERQRQSFAIMGNVAYPVNLDKVDLSSNEKNLINNYSIDMFFSIGDLSVAASREGLSYNEKTTDAIVDRIRLIIKEEKDRVEKTLSSKKCYWDAVVWLNKEKYQNRIISLLFQNTRLTYKGRVLDATFTIPRTTHKDEEDKPVNSLTLKRIVLKSKWSYKEAKNISHVSNSESVWKLQAVENYKFFIHDCKTRHMVRVKSYMEQNKDITSVFLIKSNDNKLIEELVEHLGIVRSSVTLLSDIEVPKVNRKKRSRESAVGHLVQMNWGAKNVYASEKYWNTIHEDDDFDINDGGFYVPINRWKVMHDGEELPPRDILCTVNSIYSSIMDSKTPPVYGIKKAKVDLLKKNPKWVNWIDHTQKVIRDHAVKPSVFGDLQIHNNSRGFNYQTLGTLFNSLIGHEEFRNKNNIKLIVGSTFLNQCECPILEELAIRYDNDNSIVGKVTTGKTRKLLAFIRSGKSILTDDEVKGLDTYVNRHQELITLFFKKYRLAKGCWDEMRKKDGISHMLRYINAINNYDLIQTKQEEGEEK